MTNNFDSEFNSKVKLIKNYFNEMYDWVDKKSISNDALISRCIEKLNQSFKNGNIKMNKIILEKFENLIIENIISTKEELYLYLKFIKNMVEKNKKKNKDPFNLVATELNILKITKEILNLHLKIEKS
jgi:molybdenum cofactor biosynthesis enzyme MoaA